MRVTLAFALIIAALTGPALAGATNVVAAAAPRMLSADESEPWKGVGRVNVATMGRTGMCTGTLIAPDLVLTAAHCVTNRRTQETFAPGNVHFVAGWRLGRMAAHSTAAAIAVHPDYLVPTANGPGRLSRDLAVIRLQQAIPRAMVRSFSVGLEAPSEKLTLISYRRDRQHALSRQDGCEVIEDRGPVMLLACEAVEGVSGSPVFAGEGRTARVVGVVSAMGRIGGREVAVATEVGDVLSELVAALR